MAKCDMCGKHTSSGSLNTLLPPYRLADVEDICADCLHWVNKAKAQMLAEISDRVQIAIAERMQARLKKQPWWKRLSQKLFGGW